MVCPLCGFPLMDNGPTIHSIWQDMESDAQDAVVVHLHCAWQAIRDKLCQIEDELEEGEVSDRWNGWEPWSTRPWAAEKNQ